MKSRPDSTLSRTKSTVVVIVLRDVQQGATLRRLQIAEEDDVDVAVGLQQGKPCLFDGDDRFLHFLAEPLQYEVLGPRASEVDWHSVLEEDESGEALDLELCLKHLVLIQVDLCESD